MTADEIRLTSLAHGGGCGCKLSPTVLRDLLAEASFVHGLADLLVGNETADDAAVYRLDDRQALVATVDFFPPIVDDPWDFGRIAAANALSDVYAMGGTPLLALAILGMPVGKLAPETVRRILQGGASICAQAGISVAGGHSIDSSEPIYGLVALGTVHPGKVLRNVGAQEGDVLVLTKGLGVGIFSAALKRGVLSAEDYATFLASTTQLNAVGQKLPALAGVHAATDVTGFGLIGHLLEMARASGLAANVRMDHVPLLPGAGALAHADVRTGAGTRNWESCRGETRLAGHFPEWQRALLCDPQTSGGLLIAVAPETVQALLALLHEEGFVLARAIGTMQAGTPGITVS